MTIVDRLAVGRGDSAADLALRNALLVNVWSGEIYPTDIIIYDGKIIALANDYVAKQEIDLGARYVLPGFIDAPSHCVASICCVLEVQVVGKIPINILNSSNIM